MANMNKMINDVTTEFSVFDQVSHSFAFKATEFLKRKVIYGILTLMC